VTGYNLHDALLGLGEDWMRRKGEQRGSVRQRGAEWHVYFRRLTTDAEGNAVWLQTSRLVGPAQGPQRLTRAQAERKAYDEIVSKANGLTVTPGASVTVGEFYDARYAVDVLPTLSRSTRMSWESIWRKHVAPSLSHCPISTVNRAMVQTIITGKQRAKLSPQTITHIRNRISSVFNHARRLNYFSGENPTEDIVLPRMERKERRALTRESFDVLLSQLPDERLRVAVILMAYLGLRVGEAAGLRWQCVNLGEAVQYVDGVPIPPFSILVREQYHRNRFARLKTDSSKSILPLTSDVWVPLSEWFGRSKFTAPADTVLAGRNGQPLDAHNEAARRLKPAAIRAGMPWVSWHTLRHTASTWAAQVLTTRENMDLLRHQSAAVNLSYTHADLARIREKLENMNTKGPIN